MPIASGICSGGRDESAHDIQLFVARLDPLIYHAGHGKNAPFHRLQAVFPHIDAALGEQREEIVKTGQEGHKDGGLCLLRHGLKTLKPLQR